MTPQAGHFLNPEALQPFFERLSHAATSPVHILQFGDSQTASDDWVNAMRVRFQADFGNGGPGWVTAGHIRYYRRWDARGENSPGWTIDGAVGHPGDGRMGLGGFALTAMRPGETVSVTIATDKLMVFCADCSGRFSIEADDQPADPSGADGLYSISAVPGEHTYTFRTTTTDPVRIFGWTADNRAGVTWETLGINGAQAKMILGWDEAVWTAQLRQRKPALTILAYGTNEATSPKWTANEYREDLQRIVARFKKAVPTSALLLVGPPDCGRARPFPHLSEVIRIQKEVASQTGVAFWDWREHMGGPGSDRQWVRAGLMQQDYVHLTAEGYRLLGNTLAAELKLEFERK